MAGGDRVYVPGLKSETWGTRCRGTHVSEARRGAPGPGRLGEKGSSGLGDIGLVGVLRLRFSQRAARSSAQDDGGIFLSLLFLWGWSVTEGNAREKVYVPRLRSETWGTRF